MKGLPLPPPNGNATIRLAHARQTGTVFYRLHVKRDWRKTIRVRIERNMSQFEQRANIKFCQRLGKSGAETVQLLENVYGEQSLSRSKVFEWHRRFREGRESLEDDERSGRPTTSRVDANILKVKQVVLADRRQTVEQIAQEVGISYGSCQAILTQDLGMHRVCQHIVPRNLSQEQCEYRLTTCGDLITRADADPMFLKKIITGDETWCFLYDPQSKRQSAVWKTKSSPRPKKFRQDRSKGKVMLEVFSDWKGIIHHEFIPQGATVNKERYLEVLRRLREAIRKKRPELWASQDWFLLHDNAPAHRALVVQQYLTKVVIPHPPYSSDLAPCDFYMFPKLKELIKGRHFTSAENVTDASQNTLRQVARNGFQTCFEQLYGRWQKCVVAAGQYFEGNCV